MKKDSFKYIWTDKKRVFFGLPWSFTRYFLTETKFITRTGFLSVDEDEIDLYKITDKKVKFPFWQRIVNCGTIIIYSRDTDTPSKEVRCIKNVRQVSELIDKHLTIMRDRYGIRGRDMMGFHGGHDNHDGDDYDNYDYHDGDDVQ
ncbi:MAG: PH domain-containing protein [Ruminococcus sp.]|nr:PH domain-containing protein [Ruminococcus sp.]